VNTGDQIFSGNNRQKGSKSEQVAADFLTAKGFEILKRNFHFGRTGEIDIIARHKNYLVFIEVKARGSDTYGDPLFSITPKKQMALRRAAEGYLYINKISGIDCRFDIVTIDWTSGEPKIEHLVSVM
jgi:putative endonuclease